MPVSRSRRILLRATALTLALGIVTLAHPAYSEEPSAFDEGADSEQQGGSDTTGIYAAAKIQYSGSVAKGGGTGNVTSADVNWTPPPCWYAPYLGAKDFKKEMSGSLDEP